MRLILKQMRICFIPPMLNKKRTKMKTKAYMNPYLAGFLLGILQSFASMNEVKAVLPGIDQIIIYLVAIIILLTRPRGLMGRKGVMED